MLRFFKRRQADHEKLDELKRIIRLHLDLRSDHSVSISEIECGEPSCPGLETVVLILHPKEKTRAIRVPNPLAEVNETALVAALGAAAKSG